MPHFKLYLWTVAPLAIFLYAAACDTARAQPTNYSDYFRQSYSTQGASGVPTPNRYLYDKYFYHRESVSPYMNVFRPDTARGTSYQAYVQPELRRRAATTPGGSYVQQKQSTQRANPTPSAYYNHWYGGYR